MADEKYQFTALGLYLCGDDLERLEWAIASIENPTQLASFVEPLRRYEQIPPFEDVGRGAKLYHDML